MRKSTLLLLFAVTIVACHASHSAHGADWFVGPWIIQYRAAYSPERKAVGAEQEVDVAGPALSFSGGAICVVYPERSLQEVKDHKVTTLKIKGGLVVFEDRQAEFFHRTSWKTSDGKPGDYVCKGLGTLVGTGQFDATSLKLNLEWSVTGGRGTLSDQPISQPLGKPNLKSEWVLKPPSPPSTQAKGAAKTKLMMTASRTVKVPQELPNSPSLDVVEQITVRQADIADLEATIQKLENPAPGPHSYRLAVTIKNAGPDAATAPQLGIVLPSTAEPSIDNNDAATAEGSLVTIRLPTLQSGESRTVSLAFLLEQPPSADAPDLLMIDARHSAYDPNPANNGAIDRLLILLKK